MAPNKSKSYRYPPPRSMTKRSGKSVPLRPLPGPSAEPAKSILTKANKEGHDRTVKFLDEELRIQKKKEARRLERERIEEIKNKPYVPYKPGPKDKYCYIFDPKEYLHKLQLKK